MVDSSVVLYGQTMAYSLYCIAIILVMGWFGYNITKLGKSNIIKPAYFYSFVAFLAILGVSLHLITYSTIPWTALDLNRDEIKPDKIFEIKVSNHQFQLPSPLLNIKVNEKVLFDVRSLDLTYGFGLFRKDHSMLFQMQVVPGHKNDIMWYFNKPGIYTIRSTEYSGPKGTNMVLPNVVIVSEN